jgi:serine phosphatase RsbU (regulator of sigma subunit)
VTFAAAVLDPARATILLLSAGHGPLLYYRAADDIIEEFETHGLPLAVFPMAVYGPPRPLNMLPGDFLCLVTDGFFEWQRPDETQFGKQRLIDALRSAKNLPAKDIIAAAYREVSAFVSPARQQDDLTAVIIKRDHQTSGQKMIAQS